MSDIINLSENRQEQQYTQNWPSYNDSQSEEKERFFNLLWELLECVEEPIQTFGRPRIAIKNLIFASALKVYTQFSLRRFMSDLKFAKEKEYLKTVPCFSSIGHFMQRESITPILRELIELSAKPFVSVETQFAVDSTGFRTTKFTDYYKMRYDVKKAHMWLKVHACIGIKTNIVTSVIIGNEWSGDCNKFVPLVEQTHDNGFDVKEVSADKAYNSRNNLACVENLL
jgi:hypothetical protein